MKKAIIAILIIILIVATGTAVWVYIDNEETKKLDATSVTLKEELSIEFGKKAKISDFIAKLDGSLVSDNEIDTEKLGDIPVSFEYINIKNKKRQYEFTIKTIDKNAPKIFSGKSYTVTVGYKKELTDVLLSGDDIDDNPTREIVGEYDFNTVRRLSINICCNGFKWK